MVSDEEYITHSSPQGSILGPLLFLIYVNVFPNCLRHSTLGMFADDTDITITGWITSDIEPKLKSDWLEKWLETNRLSSALLKHVIRQLDLNKTSLKLKT